MNRWTGRINSVLQVELPYWQDQNQWNLKLGSQVQYSFDSNNAMRLSWDFEQQDHKEWNKVGLGYIRFF